MIPALSVLISWIRAEYCTEGLSRRLVYDANNSGAFKILTIHILLLLHSQQQPIKDGSPTDALCGGGAGRA